MKCFIAYSLLHLLTFKYQTMHMYIKTNWHNKIISHIKLGWKSFYEKLDTLISHIKLGWKSSYKNGEKQINHKHIHINTHHYLMYLTMIYSTYLLTLYKNIDQRLEDHHKAQYIRKCLILNHTKITKYYFFLQYEN